MKCSVFLVAMALYALNLASAQSTIKLRQLGGHEDLNHTNYIDHEAMRVAAKYAKNAQMYFQNTGKHHSVVNGTTLSRRADSGDIKLRMLDAATWVGDIEVGTPGQKQTVKFDSGSPNIVIGRDSYKPDQSITAKGLRKDFEVAYVGPKVHGSIYTDDVNFAGVQAKHVWQLEVPSQISWVRMKTKNWWVCLVSRTRTLVRMTYRSRTPMMLLRKTKKISSMTTSSNFIFEGAGIRIWMGSIHGSMA